MVRSKKRGVRPKRAYEGRERRKPVLIIQHAPHEHPAALRRALESQGILTDWVHPYRGDDYPSATEICGLVSLGGPMGANDEAKHPWIVREIELMRKCVDRDLPTVGICLGGQLLARALGAKVEPNPVVEVGWFPLELNEEGRKDPVMGAAGPAPTVYHWHEDTFQLPKEAVLLAKSQVCARQAYRVGERVYGFQFHPEADHQLVLEWLSIEGIDEEIEAWKKRAARTVQDSQTQRNQTLTGEKGSLKITAGIASLFRRHAFNPIKASFREKLQDWLSLRAILIAEFEGSHRKTVQIQGWILQFLEIPTGEFIIFQEENGLLWPIRIDDIKKLAIAPV